MTSDERQGMSRRQWLGAAGLGAAALLATGGLAVVTLNRRGKDGGEERVTLVDARAVALAADTPPALEGDPKLMPFDRQLLPKGDVELQIDARQLFQLANITNDEGNLRALVLPKKDGRVQILELQPDTKIKLAVHMGKSEQPVVPVAEKPDFEYDKPVHWVKDIAKKIEENNATKGAANTSAIKFYAESSGLVGNYAAAVEQSRLSHEIKNAPDGFKSGLGKGTRLNWDPYAEEALKARLNPAVEKK